MVPRPIDYVADPPHATGEVCADKVVQVVHKDDKHLGVSIRLRAGVVDVAFGVYGADQVHPRHHLFNRHTIRFIPTSPLASREAHVG